ncbi:MAG: hypothetical protein L0Z62_30730 [Gemmataceae bacterium]|nr:hypothetical protein [Gemmataceae bacterium]
MSRKQLLIVGALLLLLIPRGAQTCRGDFEDKLLDRFRQEKEAAAQDLKREVADVLARASSTAPGNPEEVIGQLRKILTRLRDDYLLPRADRDALLRQVQERLRALEPVVPAKDEKEAPARERPAPTPKRKRQPAEEPGRGLQAFGAVPRAANLQVTPVVSGDRRFVRVRVAGTFTVPNFNAPLVPIQIPVPTLLYGPGGSVIAGQRVNIFQVFVQRPTVTTININTTVSVPAGGSAVVGGFSSFAEGRNEFGPPVLSGVPAFNRLVRNTAYGRDLRAPRILIGARVFSMREEEERFLAQGGGR